MAITFYAHATERIREKRLAGKHNTADLYRTTRNWIHCFLGKKELFFSQITPGFIDRFIAYLQAAGLQVNTMNSSSPYLFPILSPNKEVDLLLATG